MSDNSEDDPTAVMRFVAVCDGMDDCRGELGVYDDERDAIERASDHRDDTGHSTRIICRVGGGTPPCERDDDSDGGESEGEGAGG